MKLKSISAGNSLLRNLALAAAGLVPLMCLAVNVHAATAHKKNAPPKKDVSQELVRTETGFFEAWKNRDPNYFRSHIPANGVFWDENGTFSRDQQLEGVAKNCDVQGYNLSDFRVLPLADGAYLLTYTAEQYGTCHGEKVPVHMSGSSIYVFRDGRWQAIYRAEIPLNRQTGS